MALRSSDRTAFAVLRRSLALGLLVAFFGAASQWARAQELTPEQSASLKEVLERYGAAVRDNNTAAIFGLAPQGVLEQIAESAGASVEDMVASGEEVIDEQLSTLSDTDFSIDFDGRTPAVLPDGTLYVFVPTLITVRVPDGRLATLRSTVVAISDDDSWSVLQVDDGFLLGALENVWPGFPDVTFPQAEVVRMQDP